MSVWDYVIPIVTLIVGAIGGFAGGVFYLRRQMTKMQNDPETIQKMAKQMGYNVNRQQMGKIQQMMKTQAGKGGLPGGGAGKPNKNAKTNTKK
ncbi:YneF family protein [Gorillibacterium massiliense]|uniref:YneF family protein n=1 Tax=Gorillibacterium massiliense TaxID=1280390 RepID=UPI00059401E2|nr:YneF family protein [Gorillibacterium massiliense]